MNSILILFIILTIAFPSITYIVTNNLISTLIVMLITGLYLFLYAYPHIQKSIKRNKSFHSCYSFINTYIISLSVNGSLLAAFESTKLTMDLEEKQVIDGLSNLSELEKLDYLKKYYDFDIYYLFLSVIKVWVEQGGDIFHLAHYLIEETRRDEDYLIKCEQISKRKSVEFSLLWVFTLIIIIALRYSLNSFYSQITRNLLFQVAIVSIFVLLLLSVHLLVTKINNIQIKGYRNV